MCRWLGSQHRWCRWWSFLWVTACRFWGFWSPSRKVFLLYRTTILFFVGGGVVFWRFVEVDLKKTWHVGEPTCGPTFHKLVDAEPKAIPAPVEVAPRKPQIFRILEDKKELSQAFGPPNFPMVKWCIQYQYHSCFRIFFWGTHTQTHLKHFVHPPITSPLILSSHIRSQAIHFAPQTGSFWWGPISSAGHFQPHGFFRNPTTRLLQLRSTCPTRCRRPVLRFHRKITWMFFETPWIWGVAKSWMIPKDHMDVGWCRNDWNHQVRTV